MPQPTTMQQLSFDWKRISLYPWKDGCESDQVKAFFMVVPMDKGYKKMLLSHSPAKKFDMKKS